MLDSILIENWKPIDRIGEIIRIWSLNTDTQTKPDPDR